MTELIHDKLILSKKLGRNEIKEFGDLNYTSLSMVKSNAICISQLSLNFNHIIFKGRYSFAQLHHKHMDGKYRIHELNNIDGSISNS